MICHRAEGATGCRREDSLLPDSRMRQMPGKNTVSEQQNTAIHLAPEPTASNVHLWSRS